MVLGWEGRIKAHNRVFGTTLDAIVQNTVCDITLLCRPPARDLEIARVLVPVSNIKYALLSLKTAVALVKDKSTRIVLFHATYHDDLAGIKKKYVDELQKYAKEIDPKRFQVIIKKTNRMEEAIFAEAQNHDLIIMGAPEEGLVRRALFGDIPVNIAQKIDAPLILTKRYDGNVKSWFQKFFGSRKTMLE